MAVLAYLISRTKVPNSAPMSPHYISPCFPCRFQLDPWTPQVRQDRFRQLCSPLPRCINTKTPSRPNLSQTPTVPGLVFNQVVQLEWKPFCKKISRPCNASPTQPPPTHCCHPSLFEQGCVHVLINSYLMLILIVDLVFFLLSSRWSD